MATDSKTGEAIYYGAPGVGLRNVGSYQVSGHPYITGSGDGNGTAQDAETIKRYQFPFVSKKITVLAQPGNPNSQNLLKRDFTGDDGASSILQSGSYVWVAFASGSGHDFITHGHADGCALEPASDILAGNHYIPVTGSFTMEAKVKEIYVIRPDALSTANYKIIAELTNIPTRRMYHLTGSGITETSGNLIPGVASV